MTISSILKRGALAVALTAVAASSMTATATASTTSVVSNGFTCSPAYHTLLQYYPRSMTSSTGSLEHVYFGSTLYRWNGSSWVTYSNTTANGVSVNQGFSGWYSGLADATGLKVLVHSPAGGNYYWTMPNGVDLGPLSGISFTNLPAGYYKTAIYYYWGSTGVSGSGWSKVLSSGASYCQL